MRKTTLLRRLKDMIHFRSRSRDCMLYSQLLWKTTTRLVTVEPLLSHYITATALTRYHSHCSHTISQPLLSHYITATALTLYHSYCSHTISQPLLSHYITATALSLYHSYCSHTISQPLLSHNITATALTLYHSHCSCTCNVGRVVSGRVDR